MTTYNPSTAVYNTAPINRDYKPKKCINCRKKCDDTKGHVYTLNSINEVLEKINSWLLDNYSSEKKFLTFGFSKSCKQDPVKRKKLLSLKSSILHYYEGKKKGYTTLCNDEINNIISLAHQLMGLTYTSNLEESVNIDYPEEFTSNCVPYEAWERAMYIKAPKLIIKSKPVQECMGFTYDIKVKSKNKETANCFLVDFSSSIKDICDLTYTVNVKPQVCQIEYDILVRNIPSCSIGYSLYVTMREDGFTKDLITQLEELNIVTERDPETGGYLFTTSEGNTYTSKSLVSVDEIINNI